MGSLYSVQAYMHIQHAPQGGRADVAVLRDSINAIEEPNGGRHRPGDVLVAVTCGCCRVTWRDLDASDWRPGGHRVLEGVLRRRCRKRVVCL